MFDLTGKTALVTGASGGIGEAVARALHAQGAIVVLHGTRAEKLEALKRQLGASRRAGARARRAADERSAPVPRSAATNAPEIAPAEAGRQRPCAHLRQRR